ncbi:MAG: TIGR03088 family PEP-CTERM/XrtA system glycosyltransferase [Rubrivivax sp.]|nr:TIGR03088 family PEP-CTERM/XrtA system glycosyltransferase [Rubrivivax sp.]
MPAPPALPLVAHVVYRFDTGGLENGVVNLINRMSAFRHAVIAVTEVAPAFAARVTRPDTAFVELHKPPGHGWRVYRPFVQAVRRLRPAIVHTRNLAALEMQLPAWACGVRGRVHGEHGRDVEDLDGTSRRHQWMRRVFRPFVGHQVALSADLADYLRRRVGVPAGRLTQIINGVDTQRFAPAAGRTPIAGSPFDDPSLWLVGTVGRMQTVKAQPLLARAFVRMLDRAPMLRDRARLVMVGEGPLREECERVLRDAGLDGHAWFAGVRGDVADVMRGLNCFALPSLAEGISNTILEAMACGLPVVATGVGGNAELVADGETGAIVPAGDVDALAAALLGVATDPARAASAGARGRQRVEAMFSLDAMVAAYEQVYRRVLAS